MCVSLEHCWPTHINHLYSLFEAVIMVYHTLQMHYNSPILTRPTYIITRGRMHYICMCMYIITYMCIYTDIHVTDLFMYFAYIHVFIYSYIYIYIYICCFSFPVYECGWCANESVEYEKMWLSYWVEKKSPLFRCYPITLLPSEANVYLIKLSHPSLRRFAHNLRLICRIVPK